MRVLGTDYGSSWVRELTWALLLGEELFAAAAPADPHGNSEEREPIGSSSVYSKAYHTRITRFRASGTGFQTLPGHVFWTRNDTPAGTFIKCYFTMCFYTLTFFMLMVK